MDPARKLPTRADLEALPVGTKGEINEGVLYTMTRPRALHQRTALDVGSDLRDPFQRGRGGPGGWWILPEPGIALPDTPEIAPDIAGWRRDANGRGQRAARSPSTAASRPNAIRR